MQSLRLPNPPPVELSLLERMENLWKSLQVIPRGSEAYEELALRLELLGRDRAPREIGNKKGGVVGRVYLRHHGAPTSPVHAPGTEDDALSDRPRLFRQHKDDPVFIFKIAATENFLRTQ